jgi:hypothetical protein
VNIHGASAVNNISLHGDLTYYHQDGRHRDAPIVWTTACTSTRTLRAIEYTLQQIAGPIASTIIGITMGVIDMAIPTIETTI